MMANTSAVYARIDADLKSNAESILSRLGITPSGAIQMLYSQIVLQNGLPFVPKLPNESPVAAGAMSHAMLDQALQAGVDSILQEPPLSLEAFDAELKQEFGI